MPGSTNLAYTMFFRNRQTNEQKKNYHIINIHISMGSIFRDNLMSDHVAIAKKMKNFQKPQIFIAKSIY